MRLLDTYALSTGSTIDKPFIFDSYFPIIFSRYITFQAQTKFDSKDYSYWQDVINIIFPVLNHHNIKILQIGGEKEAAYQYTVDVRGKTDLRQLAYIIKNAMLHVGSDSLGVHMASAYDVPIVGLYSVSQAEVSGPCFGSKDKQILFNAYLRTRNGKPTYAAQEAPKSIDLIKPEEIAVAIFKLLGIEFKAPFETVYMGQKYSSKVVREFVPNIPIQIQHPESPLEIRMDIEFNEQVLVQQLTLCKGIIVTKKRINKNILKQFKPNITALIYEITEDDEPLFINDIKDLGINIILISHLSSDAIRNKKINYYEFGKINQIEPESLDKINPLKEEISNLYFRSNKIVCSNGKFYMGNAARILNEEITNDFNYYKVHDHPEFWKELAFMSIVKKV
jgi:hypothetical protein